MFYIIYLSGGIFRNKELVQSEGVVDETIPIRIDLFDLFDTDGVGTTSHYI